ncbi:hypothetical protein BDZ97DRAFT_1786025 [Flammula alnicola]|nr:hypothetical protein BDZ97DRAFT_1786025 [Flammula alnicola]
MLWSGLRLRSNPVSLSLLYLNFCLIVNTSSLSVSAFSSSVVAPTQIQSNSKPSTSTASSRTLTVSSATFPTIHPTTSTEVVVSNSTEAPMPVQVSSPSKSSKTLSTKFGSTANVPVVVETPPTVPPPLTDAMPTSPAVSTGPAVTHSSSGSSSRPPASVSTKDALPSPSSSHPATSPHPPATPPKPTTVQNSATHTSSSHTTSTTTSVTVVHATGGPSKTSTVTTQADSTFSTPVALTTTGSNGAKVITTPPLVTMWSTSTESDGVLATVTHVVANPGSNSGQQLTSSSGLFHKQGAVAGIFVVVGLVVASLIAGLIFCIRRKRRADRRRRWLAGMQQQRPLSFPRDPFQDPNDDQDRGGEPMMRTVDSGQSGQSGQGDVQWGRTSPALLLGGEPTAHEYRNFGHRGASLYPDPHPMFNPTNMVDFVELERQEQQNVGLAHSLDVPNRAYFRHSMAPSTPSIYPATLPPDEDDHREAEEAISKLAQRESVVPVPPRPPRSHLRESAKSLNYGAPPTPPTSVSSASHSNPPSPISESHPYDLFTRRTLLDVGAFPLLFSRPLSL